MYSVFRGRNISFLLCLLNCGAINKWQILPQTSALFIYGGDRNVVGFVKSFVIPMVKV